MFIVYCQMWKPSCWVMVVYNPFIWFRERNENCWERQSHAMQSLDATWTKNGFWAWNTSYQEIQSPHSLLSVWLITLWGRLFPILDSVRALLFCLSMGCQWPSGTPPAFSISHSTKEGLESFPPLLIAVEREGCVHRPIALRQLLGA